MLNTHPQRPLLAASAVFLLVAIAAAGLIWNSERHDRQEARARVFDMAGEYAGDLQRSIEHGVSATYSLAALVRQGKGSVPNFEEIASQLLPFYPGVSELALVPGGVIRNVVPLAGNEKALGFDLLQDPAQKREAYRAKDSGRLTLAGPLDLIQGGRGLVGRLPVFLDDNTESPRFWGFTLVMIRLPEALDVVKFSQLAEQGFAYALTRVHPDSGQVQHIAASSSSPLIEPVVRALLVPNATWILSVAPVAGWGDPAALAVKVALGLIVSLLLAFVAKLVVELRAHKQGLEALVDRRTAEFLANESRYRELFEANPQPMWVFDLESLMFLAVNDAAVAHYGYSREEFLAMNIAGIRPPEEAERMMQRVAEVRKEDVRDAGVWRHRRKNGSVIDVEIAAHTLYFAGRRAQIVHANDVTERLRVERELRESEGRYRALTELSSDWYWEQDENQRITLLSTPTTESQGAVFPSFIGKTRREVAGAAYDESQLVALEAICELRQPFRDFDMDRSYGDGLKRHVQLSGEPVFDAAGRFTGYRGVGKDITERKLAEEKLHESEARYRALVEWSPESIIVHRDGKVIFANPTAIKTFGAKSAQDLEGKPVLDLVHPDFHQSWLERARRIVGHGDDQPMMERILLRLDGTKIEAETKGTSIFYEGAPAIHLAIHDLTGRKQAERDLRLAASVFEHTQEGIVITDAGANIVSVNRRFTEITGYAADEAMGRNPRLLKSGRQGSDFYRAMWAFINTHGYWTGELWNRHKDGRVYPEWLSISTVRDDRGEVSNYLAVFVDISERKREEAELQRLNERLEQRVAERTQALEVANRELEAFSYSVSHDLRAPLRAIQGFSRLVETQYAGLIDDQGRDMLRRVGAGAQKMGVLIDDLLNLSRISRQVMRVRMVDLSALAREIADELHAGEHQRRVEWIIAPQVSAEGDPGLFRVMLQNLIGNAWKYSSRRDDARIEFGVAEMGDRSAYFVRDNGAGFDMAYATKLFGAFQRLHSNSEFPGTGIGLATVARILHRHGGRVWADGRVGEGATFYFSLDPEPVEK